MAKTYNLFISHSWTYGDAYDKLVNMLNNTPYFSYCNYSVPKNDPIHNAPNQAALRQAIKNQMSSCHAVLILAGVYSTYSKWINGCKKGFWAVDVSGNWRVFFRFEGNNAFDVYYGDYH